MSRETLLIAGVLPGFVAALSALFLKRAPKLTRAITLGALGLSAGILGCLAFSTGASVTKLSYPWIPSWGISFGLKLDALSAFVAATVAFLGFVDLIYCFGYTKPEEVGSSFYGWISLFVASMIGVVMSTDLMQFYFLWELMLIPSTALIVYWGTGKNPEATGFKYFIITHVGALMILISFLWIMNATGTSDMDLIAGRLAALSPGVLTTMAVLLLGGFAVKMAIVPFHIWLPDAHSEAPLPVSVLLSAVMMDMGIYGMLRFLLGVFPSRILQSLSLPVMIFGVISQWYGGLEALGQTQMKRIAAYSTISQMGYVLFGIGSFAWSGVSGSVLHILNHGLAKALLFMTVGSVIHATGAHDLDEVGGLGRKMPLSALFGITAAFGLAGAPPLSSFHSEWRIFAGGFDSGRTAVTVVAVACSVLTAYYALRMIIRIFFGPGTGHENARESPPAMLAAMTVLALSSVLIGFVPRPLSVLVDYAVKTLGLGG